MVIDLNNEISPLFGEHRARLQLQRTPIGNFDLLIGCTALHHNLTVLTDNRKDFQRIERENRIHRDVRNGLTDL